MSDLKKICSYFIFIDFLKFFFQETIVATQLVPVVPRILDPTIPVILIR